jgi:predicted O-methyltransferase YrrM
MILKMRNNLNLNGLLDLINDLPYNLTMLEIGCYAGESTELFLKSGKIKKLYAVDIWNDDLGYFSSINPNHNFSEVEKIFDEKIKGYDVIKYKNTIANVSSNIHDLDFIYIDANHEYEYVMSDINESLKMIKKGGIISGHDYNLETPGVIKAVDEIFGNNIKIYSDSSWLVKL